jgi:hypothetical protein
MPPLVATAYVAEYARRISGWQVLLPAHQELMRDLLVTGKIKALHLGSVRANVFDNEVNHSLWRESHKQAGVDYVPDWEKERNVERNGYVYHRRLPPSPAEHAATPDHEDNRGKRAAAPQAGGNGGSGAKAGAASGAAVLAEAMVEASRVLASSVTSMSRVPPTVDSAPHAELHPGREYDLISYDNWTRAVLLRQHYPKGLGWTSKTVEAVKSFVLVLPVDSIVFVIKEVKAGRYMGFSWCCVEYVAAKSNDLSANFAWSSEGDRGFVVTATSRGAVLQICAVDDADFDF